jgi:molecular chaperone DnaK (HSP70)
MNSEIIVGIDLGTTNSAIAYVNSRQQPEVLPNAEGKRTTPSVVQVGSDGCVVGEIAKQEVVIEKENTAQFFKRDMGTPTVYDYRGKPFTPTDLSAEVLKKLKRDAEAALDTPIRRAVITVPAYFQDAARVQTRTAGEKAGLEVVQIINEPTAAALAYGFKQTQRDETILVYDLGGGTFDITLVRVSPAAIDVIGTDGNHNLGGKDWDDRLVQHLCEEFRRRHGIDPLDDAYTFQEILLRAEDAKKTLSERMKAVVLVNCQGKMDRVEVTRDEFAALTQDLLAQTEILIGKVLQETRHDLSRVSAILMVGGSTRMPMCGELVKRLTGRAPNMTVNPDECVAIGAAIQALDYVESKRGATGLLLRRERIQDVMSHSMGMIALSADGGRYLNSVLISKNRPIPCREVRPYQVRTRDRGGNSVSVFVTQGEGDDLANCSYVGKYVIGGISHVKKGVAVLDIAYDYDRSGVVSVSATERSTGQAMRVVKEKVPEDMSWVFRSPKELTVAHKLVYLAVDLSGSMSGQPLEDARGAVRAFVENSDLAHTSIGLMSFADSVHIDQTATQDAHVLDRAVAGWSIGSVGGGNSTHPFDEVLSVYSNKSGPRYLIVLTDGVWSYQTAAERSAKECAQKGIEIIALGFGGADEAFLRRISTSEAAALYSSSAELTSAFENIAQVLVEAGGDGVGIGRGLIFRRGR